MSTNYNIVQALYNSPRPIEYMRYNFTSFRKRLYDLKKMGFDFEEVLDTETWLICIDMTYIPEETIINKEKQTIKVGNYWRDYRNKLNKREQLMSFINNATHIQLLYLKLKALVKEFISKLFK